MGDLRSRGTGSSGVGLRGPTFVSSSSSVSWATASSSTDEGVSSARQTTMLYPNATTSSSSSPLPYSSSSSSSSASVYTGSSYTTSCTGVHDGHSVFPNHRESLPRTESDADKQQARLFASSRPRKGHRELAVQLGGMVLCFLTGALLIMVVHFTLLARETMVAKGDFQVENRHKLRGPLRTNSADARVEADDLDMSNLSVKHPWDHGGKGAHQEFQEAGDRRNAVKEGFLHAWKGYKTYAWGKDSLHPVSKSGSDDFLGMAISIVDSMDTALIMGLDDIFEEQYAWVVKNLKFGDQENINVFETTIRVVGGLLSAYALSGRQPLLDFADDLATKLLPAFQSNTGIPYGTLGLKSGKKYNPSWVQHASSVAEAGTLQLEFRYLAKLTGKREYREKVDRIFRFFEGRMQDSRSKDVLDGLFPMFVHPETGDVKGNPIITFGARGDSLYEYFLKTYIQTDCSEDWLLRMYDTSMMGMTKHLLMKTSGKNALTYVAEMNKNEPHKPIKKMDHLVCFVPGMLALGSIRGAGSSVKDHATHSHLAIAERLMKTCYAMYSTTATGLAPEIAHMDQDLEIKPKAGAKHSLLRPETAESLFILWRVTKNPTYREWGWNIFQAIEKYARIPTGGYSGINDVTQLPPVYNDKMDSFFVAETLKYLYLLFSPDDVIPLDKYVFSTEAHPLPIFKWD